MFHLLLDGEKSVEKKNALGGPLLQATAVVLVVLKVRNVVFELNVDVPERRRHRFSLGHTES